MKSKNRRAAKKALETSLAKGVEIVRKLNVAVHDELKHKPEALAEWDAIMAEYADILAEDETKSEEAKLKEEMNEHIARIAADAGWLASLGPMDLQTNLEVEERLTRTFAAWHEVDEIMRLRARDFPDMLARWEEGAVKPMRECEAIFEAGAAAEKARPEN